MNDIDLLNQMIKDSAKVNLVFTENSTKANVTLIEPEVENSAVTICGLPDNTIVIKVDKFASPDTIFAGTKSECKRSDFIIVSDDNAKKRILYIELKSTKAPEKDIINQLKGSMCFVGYCREIAKVFWSDRTFLNNFEPRFVSFGHTVSIAKRRTKVERISTRNDAPEYMLKIHRPHKQQYNHLVGV